MPKKYSYNFPDNVQKIVDVSAPKKEGYEKQGNLFVRGIELEDSVLVEQRPIIKTTIEIYATARWTDGREARLRVPIEIEYVAGFEDEILADIEAKFYSAVFDYGEGFDRIDPDSVDFEEIEFPDPDSDFVFEEKPVFERRVDEQTREVVQTERAPTPVERIGRQARGFVGRVAGAVGGIVKGIGKIFGFGR